MVSKSDRLVIPELLQNTEKRAFIVTGTNPFWLDFIRAKLIKKFDIDQESIFSIGATTKNTQAVMQSFGSCSLFSNRRLVIVRDFNSFIDKRNFKYYLEDEDLIVLALIDKKKKKEEADDGWLSKVDEKVENIDLNVVNYSSNLNQNLLCLTKFIGINIEEALVKLIWKESCFDWAWFNNNLVLLKWYAEEVTPEIIRSVCGKVGYGITNKLVQSLLAKNFSLSWTLMEIIEKRGEMPIVLYFLESELFRIVSLNLLIDRGLDDKECCSRLGISSHKWSMMIGVDLSLSKKLYSIVSDLTLKMKRGVPSEVLGVNLLMRFMEASV